MKNRFIHKNHVSRALRVVLLVLFVITAVFATPFVVSNQTTKSQAMYYDEGTCYKTVKMVYYVNGVRLIKYVKLPC